MAFLLYLLSGIHLRFTFLNLPIFYLIFLTFCNYFQVFFNLCAIDGTISVFELYHLYLEF